MAEASSRFRVGYALAPKKIQSFIQQSFIDCAKKRGIDLVRIISDVPLVEQGPFDCVIQKLYGQEWRKQLADFAIRNPRALIFDPPDAIQRLHSRISMLQVVSEIKIDDDGDTFGIPLQVVIYDSNSLSNPPVWGGLRFPVIAKPLVADGSAKSHKMSLVFSDDAMSKLKPPLVLQEFVNHGGVIFKVYVVGEHVQCVKRRSLPDVSEEKLGSLGGSVSFSQISNLSNQDKNCDDYCMNLQLEETEYPPHNFMVKIAKGLREALALNLFNFDVIRDTRIGSRYLIIDINYFPGYAKMPNYESVLTDFLWEMVHQNVEGGADTSEFRCFEGEVKKSAADNCCSENSKQT